MTSAFSFRKLLAPHALAALTGLGLGCVITTGGGGSDECGSILSHSQETSQGCLCDPGYQWEDPDDPNNYECEPIPAKEGCDCTDPNTFVSGNSCELDPGYTWCSDDPNDCSACEDPDQADGGTGPGDDGGSEQGDDGQDSGDTGADDGADSTGGGGVCEDVAPEWNGVEPNPADCTEDGQAFCSNTLEEGPAGSRYWECIGGEWVEQPTASDEICQFDGFDFSYGCVDNAAAGQIDHECGVGPGTPCSGAACDACADSDVLQFCIDGSLGAVSCFEQCTVIGDAEGITYDFGECVDGGAGPECACCDEGDEGCNIG